MFCVELADTVGAYVLFGDHHDAGNDSPLAQDRIGPNRIFRAAHCRRGDTGAIGGGVMTGWGIMLWMLATRLYPREPALARQLIVTSIVAWFIVDSAGSILSGAPLNALFNVSFLLIFCVPLWRAA